MLHSLPPLMFLSLLPYTQDSEISTGAVASLHPSISGLELPIRRFIQRLIGADS